MFAFHTCGAENLINCLLSSSSLSKGLPHEQVSESSRQYLDDPHVQARLRGQLLSDVARRLGRVLVGTFEGLQLLCRDGGPRSFGPSLRIV